MIVELLGGKEKKWCRVLGKKNVLSVETIVNCLTFFSYNLWSYPLNLVDMKFTQVIVKTNFTQYFYFGLNSFLVPLF